MTHQSHKTFWNGLATAVQIVVCLVIIALFVEALTPNDSDEVAPTADTAETIEIDGMSEADWVLKMQQSPIGTVLLSDDAIGQLQMSERDSFFSSKTGVRWTCNQDGFFHSDEGSLHKPKSLLVVGFASYTCTG